jgi:hypothetical protein
LEPLWWRKARVTTTQEQLPLIRTKFWPNIYSNNKIDIELNNADNLSDNNIFVNPSNGGHLRLENPHEWLEISSWQNFYGKDKISTKMSGSFKTDAINSTATLLFKGSVINEIANNRILTLDYFGKPISQKRTAGPFNILNDNEMKFILDPRKCK